MYICNCGIQNNNKKNKNPKSLDFSLFPSWKHSSAGNNITEADGSMHKDILTYRVLGEIREWGAKKGKQLNSNHKHTELGPPKPQPGYCSAIIKL